MTYQETALQQNTTAITTHQKDERRANCRIWAHMLFWWIVPFGWILSVYKTRDARPAYVMLAAMGLALLTPLPEDTGPSAEEHFISGFEIGQRYGSVGAIVGSVVTIQGIMKARQNLEEEAQQPEDSYQG